MRISDLLHAFYLNVEDTNFAVLLNVFNCFLAKIGRQNVDQNSFEVKT